MPESKVSAAQVVQCLVGQSQLQQDRNTGRWLVTTASNRDLWRNGFRHTLSSNWPSQADSSAQADQQLKCSRLQRSQRGMGWTEYWVPGNLGTGTPTWEGNPADFLPMAKS